MTTEGIAAVLDRLQDGCARHDAAAVAGLYAEDCVVETPLEGRQVGRSAVERTYRSMFAAFPNVSLQTEEFLIFGNRAVWTFIATGSDLGGFMGSRPTRKPVSMQVMSLFAFGDDGRIVHERQMYDSGRGLLHLANKLTPTDPQHLYRDLIERAQREHELKIASDIQHALFPHSHHRGPGLEVAASSRPCRAIGGDFFDYFTLADGAFAFALADVAGKGPPAALLASRLQGIFTANAYRGDTPAATMREANTALMRRPIEARFVTSVYGVLTREGRLTYCNAGHNPPLLIGKRGVLRLETGGMVIGLFEHTIFNEQTLQLATGDLLVAYSDGVTEARNPDGEEFGEEGLLACVQAYDDLAPSELLQRVFNEVKEFSAGAAQGDDLTLLVLRFAGGR
jgi:serine phosphatase RsbU (regulator of sigma subunit)/ketosteroid isomerase-like protein